MAFLLYKRVVLDGTVYLEPTNQGYCLAGHKLIYRAWKLKGCPLNQGWQISADELIRLQTNDVETYETRRLLVDFHPSSLSRIGIIELLNISAYTWSTDDNQAGWTPLMLRFRDVYYEEFETQLVPAQKITILNRLPEYKADSLDFVEFLYLNGDSRSWNWGRNGMTNAAFIQGSARDYFRQFF